MSAKIEIQCPGCQTQYSVPSTIGEKRLRCKKCDRRFTISEARNAVPDADIVAAVIIESPVPTPTPIATPDPFVAPINNPYLDSAATGPGPVGYPPAVPYSATVTPALPRHKSNPMMVPAVFGAIIFSLAMAGAAWMHTFSAAGQPAAQTVAQNATPTAPVRDTPTAPQETIPAVAPVVPVAPARSTNQSDQFLDTETETKDPEQPTQRTGASTEQRSAEQRSAEQLRKQEQENERRRLASEQRNERRKERAAEQEQQRLARAKAEKDKARKFRLTPAADEKPTENLIMRVREASWGPNALAVTDNRYLVIADNEALRIFDWQRKSELSEYDQFKAMGHLSAIDITNDGKKLIVGGKKGRIELFNVDDSGHLVLAPVVLQEEGDDIVELALSADLTRAVSVDDKQKVILWDLESNQIISEASDFGRKVITEIHFSSDSKQFSLTDGKFVIRYAASDGKQVKKIEIDVSRCHDAAFSTDGSLIAVSGTRGLLTFTRSGKAAAECKGTQGVQWALRFADEKHFFSCASGSVAKIDATNGKLIKNFEIPDTGYIQKISISPDGTKMAVTSASARDDVFLIDVSQ